MCIHYKYMYFYLYYMNICSLQRRVTLYFIDSVVSFNALAFLIFSFSLALSLVLKQGEKYSSRTCKSGCAHVDFTPFAAEKVRLCLRESQAILRGKGQAVDRAKGQFNSYGQLKPTLMKASAKPC